MGFLSDLTLVQRAGGAAVLVLLLTFLLLKQRKAKSAPVGTRSPDDAPKSKKRASAPKEGKKGRSFSVSRKRTGNAVVDLPVAEPKAGQGRMVPRLPAPSEVAAAPSTLGAVDLPDMADPAEVTPVALAANGMINEPGWPTPGEVWAAPDAPVEETGDVESWHADAQDDVLAALATETPTETAGESTSEAELFREEARLRKRLELIKNQLRKLAEAQGLI